MQLRSLLLLVSLCSAVTAQTTLQPGIPIEHELQPQYVHDFTVKVQENDFIHLVVEQRGIDVIIKLFSPTGKALGDFDSPNGADGPEYVSFVATTAGSYRLTIGALEPKSATTGRYQIKILELRPATDQELKTHKNLELTKTKGIALLAEIEEMIPQIKSPQTRIRAQLQAGLILWDIDQKRASKLFTDATTDFKEFLTSTNDIFLFSSTIAQLRHDVVQALVQCDPDAALNFLQSTRQIMAASLGKTEHFQHESGLELSIADQVMRKDPKRALQMARQSLKQGYSGNLLGTLSELRQREPELAAEFADEIAAKVINDKLLQKLDASNIAATLIRFLPSSDFAPQSTNGVAQPPFLSEQRVKELVQKVIDEALSYSPSGQGHDPARDCAWNMLMALKSFTQLDIIIPGSSASVEKKITEFSAYSPVTGRQYVTVFGGNSAELSVDVIEKMPVETREDQYLQLAYGKGNNGDFTSARQIINERIINPSQRRFALMQLDQTEMNRALNEGKVEEVLRYLRGIQNVRERGQQLAQVANHIGPGMKRATALNLLEQIRSLLSPSLQAQDQEQMFALLEVSRAFLRYDVKRSFEIIDPLIEQFNDLSTAARKLDGFGQDYYDGEELDLQNGNPLATVASQISSVLGNQAVANFARAKATTERILAPEVRLKIYLEIAERTVKGPK